MKKKNKGKPKPQRNKTVIEQLESRILYSADALLTDALIAHQHAENDTFAPQPEVVLNHQESDTVEISLSDIKAELSELSRYSDPVEQIQEVAFVDAGIDNYQALITELESLPHALEIITLSTDSSGLQQITSALEGYQNLEAIRLYSHGSRGLLQLGSDTLTLDNLTQYQSDLASLGSHLSTTGDLLIYGCNVAADSTGKAFVQAIADYSGADTAASVNLTGSQWLGGDWQLEFTTGDINADTALSENFSQHWNQVLSTYTVSNTNDAGAGSLRQAIVDANANGGADLIDFSLGAGVSTINLITQLPSINEAVYIDGSQTGTPSVVLNGGNSINFGLQLNGGTGGSTIKGLVLQNFNTADIDIGTDNNTIIGNYIGTDSTGTSAAGDTIGINIWQGTNNTIGGNTTSDRNIISGNSNIGIVLTSSSSATIVQGNYIGTDVTGTLALGNSNIGIWSNADNNIIGGSTVAEGNLISGNGNGITLGGTGNIVSANLIGTNVSGTGTIANNWTGLYIYAGGNNQIGGSTAGERNIISGNGGPGIHIHDSSNNSILGNYVGTDISGGGILGNAGIGVYLSTGVANTTIGGTSTSDANRIAFNGGRGVFVGNSTSTGNSILGNAIYNNTGLEIDLESSGINSNDPLDFDSGANSVQNFPELDTAVIDGTNIQITGELNTSANTTYRIEFFASINSDGSGSGGAERLLDAITITTNAVGYAEIYADITSTVTAGEYVTATATVDLGGGNYGDTSEFSANIIASADHTPLNINVTQVIQGGLSLNNDGGNNNFLIAENGIGSNNLSSITYEMQFNTSDLGSRILFVSYYNGGDELMLVTQNTGDLLISVNNTTVTSSAMDYESLRDGQNHSLAFTWDNGSGDWQVFIDGVLIDSGTGLASGATIDAGGSLVFGLEQDNASLYFDSTVQRFSGTLYDTRLFNSVREGWQIAVNYSNTLPWNEDNLIANWQFNSLSSHNVIVNNINDNHLKLIHTNDPAFTASTASLSLEVDETETTGTIIGSVTATDAERQALIAKLLNADADLVYSAETGKFYKAVTTSSSWTNASTSALASLLNSVSGQLATIHTATENALMTQFAIDAGQDMWLGASDAADEGEWFWMDNGVAAEQFWQGDGTGHAIDSAFIDWQIGRPDNFEGGTQHYLSLRATGEWNDEDNNDANTGYIIEWNADEVLNATENLSYSLQSQTVAGAFYIDATSGDISVYNGALLDYETNTSHTLSIHVVDNDGNSINKNISILIRDITETASAPTDLSSGIELNTDGGNDTYLQANDGGAILGGLSSLTFETQFSISENQSSDTLISYDSAAGSNQFSLEIKSTGDLEFLINNTGGNLNSINYDTTLADGDAHHLAVTWDNTHGAWAIYIDGIFIESGTGLATGQTLSGGVGDGSLVFGQEQDSVGGSFDSTQILSGTLYDVRIFNDVLSSEEIALNHQHKYDTSNLPASLIANWQMDEFNGSNEIVEVVSGNNLTIGHAAGAGFSASNAIIDLQVDENAPDGTAIGLVQPSTQDITLDHVIDGQFLEATPSTTQWGVTGSFGGWTVTRGDIDLYSTIDYASPTGGRSIDLDASSPSTISQTLTTEIGKQYQVIFELNGDFNAGEAQKNLRVSAAGTSEDFALTEPEGWVWGDADYFSGRSMTFTADATSTELIFASLEGAASQYGAIIADIRVIEIPSAVTAILNTDSTLSYDAATGKFYQLVNNPSNFTTALTNATSTTLNNVSGQLLTIQSQYEQDWVYSQVQATGNNIWLGATDQTTPGTWNWLSGSVESSDTFWTGGSGGSPVAGQYAGTLSQSEGATEFYIRMISNGEWTDTPSSGSFSYIIEWNANEVLSHYSYSLSNDDGGRFAIDSSSGEITITDTTLINYESATSHDITVVVTNAANESYSEVMTIAVNNQGGEPLGTIPAAQLIAEDTPLIFSSGNGNAVIVSDTGASNALLQVTLNSNNGSLSLSQTTGLTLAGGSYDSAHMTINGTESNINAALEGMVFTPDDNFNGVANLDIKIAQASGLEADYSFEAGNAVDDSASPSQNGTLTGTASIVTDATRGQVLSLDGSGASVQISGNFSNPSDITLSAWVNLSAADSNGAEVISLGNNVFLRLDDTSGSNGILGSIYYSGGWHETTSDQFIAGTGWHHVAYTVDDSNDIQQLFIDGALVAETHYTGSIDYSLNTDTFLGSHGNGGTEWDLNGLIDDARIYSRALTADEIAALATDQTAISRNIAITVSAVNDAPYFTATPTSEPETLESGLTGATSVTAADLDNDGDTDLISTTNNGELRWHENDGSGNFSSGTLITTQDDFAAVAAADFDGDGDIDLVAVNDDPGNSNNTLFVFDNQFIGSGSVSFTVSSQEGSGALEYDSAQDIVVGDIDGDGRDDFVVTYYQSIGDSHIVVFEQNTTGVWSRAYTDAVQNNYGIALADMDGDGDLDIVAGDFQDGEIRWYQNDGMTTAGFTRNTIASLPAVFDIAVGDIDSDGDDDIVYVTWGSDDVGWLESSGGGTPTFSNHIIAAGTGNLMYDIELADLNNNGSLDIIVADKNDDEIRLYDNNGSAIFTESIVDNTTNGPVSIAIADLDSNGHKDIIFASQLSGNIGLHSNQGAATWITDSVNEDISISPIHLEIADVDVSSSDLEITITTTNGSITLNTAGVTITSGANSSPAITFTGDITAINAAMNSMTFSPDTDFNGLGAIQVTASDLGNSGSGGILTATNTFYIEVRPVADAPTLDNSGNLTLTSITENDINNTGETVATILASDSGNPITDPDSGAVEGIAITSRNNGNGVWQYSIDGGSNWSNVGTVSETSALLLRDTDLLRFLPNGNNGTTKDLTFRAWDQISGTAGSKVNVSSNGGSSAFSSALETASIVVSLINDAPVLDNSSSLSLSTITEDETSNSGNTLASIIASAGGDRITDVDSSSVEGVAITSLNSSNGTWQYSLDGSSWFDIGTVNNSSALLLRATDFLRFIPDGIAGDSASLNFVAWDQSSGTQGTKVDASSSGGTTAFSTASETASISVTAVNDAPVNAVPATQNVNLNTALILSTGSGNAIQISDADAAAASVEVTLTISNGLISLNGITGLSFSVGDGTLDNALTFNGAIAAINAALNGMSFNPTTGFEGQASIQIHTNDLGNSGSGGSLNDTDTLHIHVGALTFQQGLNGYTGTEDTYISDSATSSSYGNASTVLVDGADLLDLLSPANVSGILRFEDLFGSGGGQIPIGSTITSASLNLYVTQTDGFLSLLDSNKVRIYEMLIPWTESATFDAMGSGISINDIEASTTLNAEFSSRNSGYQSINSANLLSTLQGWANDPSSNYGWVFVSNGADDWAFASSENGTAAHRPELILNYTPPTASVITVTGGNASFTENGAATAIDSGLLLSDADSTILAGATIAISTNFISAEDALSFSNQNGINGSWNSALGVLTLSGNASVADYQSALRSITYSNSSEHPNTTTRTIEFTVSDAYVPSATLSRDVTLTAINDAPYNAGSLPTDISVTEDVTTNLDLSALNLNDVDAAGGHLILTLSTATGGQLSAASGTGITLAGTASALTLSGTLSDLNNYLNDSSKLSYLHSTANLSGDNTDTLSVVINDNGNSGSGGSTDQALGTLNIDITAVNDSPTVATNTGTTVNEGSNGNIITSSMLNEGDIDDAAAGLSYTVTVDVLNGTLQLNGSSIGLGDSFTQSEINAGLLSYTHDGSQTSGDNFSFSLADGGEDAAVSATGVFNISVSNINDAPIQSLPSSQSVNEDTALNINGISVADTDDNLATVQLSVDNGILNIVLSGASTITSGANGTNSVTLSGTLIDINASLASLTYQANTHFNGSDTLTLLSTDNVSATDSDTLTININPVNDAPSINVPASMPVTEDVATAITSISFTDIDAASGSVLATLSVPAGSLAANSSGLVTVAGSATALTLTGSIADINSFISAGNVLYTTALHANGNVTLNVAIDDLGNNGSGGNLTDNQSTLLAITAVNDEQSLDTNAVLTLNEGASAVIRNTLLNTSDIEQSNSIIVYQVTSLPTNGTLSLNGSALSSGDNVTQADIDSGLFSYSHNGSETLNDQFNFSVDDGISAISSATFSITITAVNDHSPVVTALQSYSISETILAGASLGFIAATDGDASTTLQNWQITSGNNEGIFIIDASTGELSLSASNLPDYEFQQQHLLGMTVSDGTLTSAVEIVTIHIIDADEFDISAISDNDLNPNRVTENSLPGTTVGITAFATDADYSDSVTYSLDGDASALFTIDATTGVISLQQSPDYELASSHSFDIVATSSDGSDSRRTVVVAIDNVNDNAPVVNNVSISISEHTLNNTIIANLQDVNSSADIDRDGDAISYQINSGNDAGIFTINALNGNISVANNTLLNYETVNSYTLTVQASDGSLSDIATVQITLSDENDTPVITSSNQQTLAENVTGPLQIVANDEDHDALNYTIVGGDDAGLFSLNALNGELFFNSAADFENPLDANQDNQYQLTLAVTDANGATQQQQITITVSNIDETPVANDESITTPEDQSLIISGFMNNDLAGDGALQLNGVDASSLQGATISLNSNGSFTYTPATNFNGSDSFQYSIIDESGDLAYATITVNVTAVNDAPVATADVISTDEDELLNILTAELLGNDTDVENNTLTIQLTTMPVHGTLTQNSDGSFTYQPNAHYNGIDTFSYRVNDGTNLSNTTTVTLNIHAVNDAPTTENAEITVDEDARYTFSSANFAYHDIDGGALKGILIEALPVHGTLYFQGSQVTETGIQINADEIEHLEFQADENDNGDNYSHIAFRVFDGETFSADTAKMTVHVTPVDDAPFVEAPTEVLTNIPGEEIPLIDSHGEGLNLIDLDENDNSQQIVEIKVAAGQLSLTNFNSDIRVSGLGTTTLTMTGSSKALSTALLNLTYLPTLGFSGKINLEITATDVLNDSNDRTGLSTTSIVELTILGGLSNLPSPTDDDDKSGVNEQNSAEPIDDINSASIRSLNGLYDHDGRQLLSGDALNHWFDLENFTKRDIPPLPEDDQDEQLTAQRLIKSPTLKSIDSIRLRLWGQLHSLIDDKYDHQQSDFGVIESIQFHNIELDSSHTSVTVAVTFGVSALTIGSILWMLRGSGLIASLALSYPAWRNVDPLPVLMKTDDEQL